MAVEWCSNITEAINLEIFSPFFCKFNQLIIFYSVPVNSVRWGLKKHDFLLENVHKKAEMWKQVIKLQLKEWDQISSWRNSLDIDVMLHDSIDPWFPSLAKKII